MKYATLDGVAVCYNDNEAWQFNGGQWKPLDTADAWFKAKKLTEAEYKKMYPDLPPYPAGAFQDG